MIIIYGSSDVILFSKENIKAKRFLQVSVGNGIYQALSVLKETRFILRDEMGNGSYN